MQKTARYKRKQFLYNRKSRAYLLLVSAHGTKLAKDMCRFVSNHPRLRTNPLQLINTYVVYFLCVISVKIIEFSMMASCELKRLGVVH